MLPSHVTQVLDRVEAAATAHDRAAVLAGLRALGPGDFGLVLAMMPLAGWPRISAALPPMATEEVTRRWTGAAPVAAMTQGMAFVRACAERHATLTGQPLTGRRVLDFGCGYGRFIRLFWFFSGDVWGVDAWQRSVDQCIAAGLGEKVGLSDVVPAALPVPGQFDLLTAFSVFTHLSAGTAAASLAALRGVARDGAMLALTIRPFEWWDYAARHGMYPGDDTVAELKACHIRDGFAFVPQGADGTYGDTSMTPEYLESIAPGWQVWSVDRNPDDSLQRYVFLRAVSR